VIEWDWDTLGVSTGGEVFGVVIGRRETKTKQQMLYYNITDQISGFGQTSLI